MATGIPASAHARSAASRRVSTPSMSAISRAMSTSKSPENKPVALIAGPTAGGKSQLAVDLAQRLARDGRRGVVVNADSQQVYRELHILSARPSEGETQGIEHRLFGTWDGAQSCSAADWSAAARDTIREIHASGGVPILCGGTGALPAHPAGGHRPRTRNRPGHSRGGAGSGPGARAGGARGGGSPSGSALRLPMPRGRPAHSKSSGRPGARWRNGRRINAGGSPRKWCFTHSSCCPTAVGSTRAATCVSNACSISVRSPKWRRCWPANSTPASR